MKSFATFISESVSNAAKQAKKLGLKGDGHGSWVDPNGRIVGRTIEGELVFNSGRKPSKGSDPLNPGAAARQAVSEVPPPSSTSQAPEAVPAADEQNKWKKQRTLTLVCRFNHRSWPRETPR